MIRMLWNIGISLIGAAIGILIAGSLLDDMTVSAGGFVVAVVIFAIAQAILSPFILKVAVKNANAFVGGVGIISTLAALIVASLLSDGIEISGAGTWILAALIVWLVAALATLVVPFLLVKAGVQSLRDDD
ncbi:superfamily IV 4 TMS phage holin [Mumia flava]|uniref:Superfamily IV 4 TMS phage holin n=1 Tax=Mumia flava TaxID=1348852 RepID=A0A0B2B275_9ACTN|nr:phage holin family protein [Mumia flava]PJJ58447.1 superfamily IV 4 TMS phage holin [Mumia flava]